MCEVKKIAGVYVKIVMQYAICYDHNLLGAYGMLKLEGSNDEALYGMTGKIVLESILLTLLCTDSTLLHSVS